VDHYPAARFDEDLRNGFSLPAIANAAHNETLVLLDYLPAARRLAFVAWAVLIGTRSAPGFVQLLRLLATDRHHAISRFVATFSGRIAGYRTWNASRRKVDAASLIVRGSHWS
jgi:hypothetical protein